LNANVELEAQKLVVVNLIEKKFFWQQVFENKVIEFSVILFWVFICFLLISIVFFIKFNTFIRKRHTTLIAENTLLAAQLQSMMIKFNAETQKIGQKMLAKKRILTPTDWRLFIESFEEVYPNFILRLVKAYPRLTKVELRFCCLSLLSLSDEEMAAMLGVGSPSIRVTRQRTKARLQIKHEESLEVFFLKFCKTN
jgi:hypothetical protein